MVTEKALKRSWVSFVAVVSVAVVALPVALLVVVAAVVQLVAVWVAFG